MKKKNIIAIVGLTAAITLTGCGESAATPTTPTDTGSVAPTEEITESTPAPTEEQSVPTESVAENNPTPEPIKKLDGEWCMNDEEIVSEDLGIAISRADTNGFKVSLRGYLYSNGGKPVSISCHPNYNDGYHDYNKYFNESDNNGSIGDTKYYVEDNSTTQSDIIFFDDKIIVTGNIPDEDCNSIDSISQDLGIVQITDADPNQLAYLRGNELICPSLGLSFTLSRALRTTIDLYIPYNDGTYDRYNISIHKKFNEDVDEEYYGYSAQELAEEFVNSQIKSNDYDEFGFQYEAMDDLINPIEKNLGNCSFFGKGVIENHKDEFYGYVWNYYSNETDWYISVIDEKGIDYEHYLDVFKK